MRFIRILAGWGGWAAFMTVIFLTIVPIDMRPQIGAVSVERFGAFFIIGFMLSIAYPRHSLAIFVLLVAAAFVLEVL